MNKLGHREAEFLRMNLGFILSQRERILADPELTRAESRVALLSIAYITGSGHLPIGLLLELWQEGSLRESCPNCKTAKEQGYMYFLGGSPLSGYSMRSGICLVCERTFDSKGGRPSLMERASPVRKKMQEWGVEEAEELGGMSVETVGGEESEKFALGEAIETPKRPRPMTIRKLVQLLKREQKKKGTKDV